MNCRDTTHFDSEDDYRTGCRNLFRTTFTRTIKLNLLLKCSIYYINTNEIPNLFNLIVLFAVKGAIYCVAIATVIFSPLKISCFPVKAHLDFLI